MKVADRMVGGFVPVGISGSCDSLIPPPKDLMKILLFNPDNGVTRNFMPNLWMFLRLASVSWTSRCSLCFAKIPCALKIVRFPAAMAAFQVIPSPSNAKNLSRGTRAVYLYI